MKALTTLASVLIVSLPLLSSAQATRTWVSGVGDDANPGSRTAPDSSFAGAITNTASGGVIDVLDPGNFGPVTITNSIYIDGNENEGNVIVSNGLTGIVINAGSTGIVTLRNLSFDGLGSASTAIQILSAGVVHIEDCRINGFETGIEDNNTTNGRVFVKDTTIHACLTNGISLSPAASSTATIQNANITACGEGIQVNSNASAVIVDSTVSGNSGAGIETAGLVQLSGSTITDNGGDGLLAEKPGRIVSYRNNIVSGNGPNGKPTSASRSR